MSKTSIILLIFVMLALGIFLYVTLGYQLKAALPSFSNSLQKNKTNQPIQSTLAFVPNTLNTQPGQMINLAINANAQGDIPDLMQFEIAYDPAVLTFIGITPGNYFSNPEIPLNNVLPRTGRISYALTCPAKNTNCIAATANTAAKITFSVNAYAARKETKVTFFPKTRIHLKDADDAKLQTQGAKIIIKGIVPPASPSAAIVPIIPL